MSEIDQRQHFGATCTILWALCYLLCGVGCDVCSGVNPDPIERRSQRLKDRLMTADDHLAADEQQRARQAIADRYRGRVVPGVGCEQCPEYCALADLRAIDIEVFAQEFRQVLIDERSPDGQTRVMAVIEHNRLTCMLEIHESMHGALAPLLDAREHPRIRFEAAWIALGFGLPAGDPKRALYELADGSSNVAHLARALIFVWDRDGWPEVRYPAK